MLSIWAGLKFSLLVELIGIIYKYLKYCEVDNFFLSGTLNLLQKINFKITQKVNIRYSDLATFEYLPNLYPNF